MALSVIFILIVCGLLVNVMSALFGIGGGILMVPILRTLFPELPFQVIAACSLTIVMGSACLNLIRFRQEKEQIDKSKLLFWSISMIAGVQIGFELSFLLSDLAITAVFSGTLALLAARTLFQRRRNADYQQTKSLKDLSYGMASCGFGGFIAGITGIGGGSIMAPLVAQIRSVHPKQIAIYTNYMMVFGGIGNLFGYLSRELDKTLYPLPSGQIGYVNFSIVGIVIISSFCTGFMTQRLRGHLSAEMINHSLSILLFFIAIYYFILNYWYT
ncbi:sulfite exporter TauE/SafE family protein [Mannheimia indoligenes]|uniref:sulfite exporter TauE/SafE family protein n=1 Tax=Mannheimia indoligenes TaxID=3103145 RepID=UPI002FE51DCC